MAASICTAPPPPGTGLRPDGSGAVHIMVSGKYTFYGAQVGNLPGPRDFTAGSYIYVPPHIGGLEWIRPDGVRELIPRNYLYAAVPTP